MKLLSENTSLPHEYNHVSGEKAKSNAAAVAPGDGALLQPATLFFDAAVQTITVLYMNHAAPAPHPAESMFVAYAGSSNASTRMAI